MIFWYFLLCVLPVDYCWCGETWWPPPGRFSGGSLERKCEKNISEMPAHHDIERLTTYIGLFQKSDQGNIASCWRFCLHLCRSSGLCQQLFPYPFFARRSFISCLLVSKVPAGRAALSRHGGKPPFRSWKMNSVISMTPSSLSLILKSELL